MEFPREVGDFEITSFSSSSETSSNSKWTSCQAILLGCRYELFSLTLDE
ncbi:unnamed protein product [Schistosoma curassoni]|uniref:Uncharacterized protein n=1 Tax=Schistosoma curassoni TaxID=6186 RepID=A0A183JSP0_9TREM|nr:unnamed protein product [Schistosoma curassoni]